MTYILTTALSCGLTMSPNYPGVCFLKQTVNLRLWGAERLSCGWERTSNPIPNLESETSVPLRAAVAAVSGLHTSGLTSSSGKGCLPVLPPGLCVASLRGQPLSITQCPCPCWPETLSCLHNTDRGLSGCSNHALAPALNRVWPLKWMQNSQLFIHCSE